jgi:hypothetical protein
LKLLVTAVAGPLVLISLFLSISTGRGEAPPQTKPGPPGRPFLAIWRNSHGNAPGAVNPVLRSAFWDDGRVLFTLNDGRSGQELLQGRISRYRVDRLKAALGRSGIFELEGYCYLAPDMAVDCVMVDLVNKQQILYWVEGMTARMDSSNRRAFVSSWTRVNDLASVGCPDRYDSATEEFKEAPRSWFLKPMIQSR